MTTAALDSTAAYTTQAAAVAFAVAGCSVLRTRTDGSKAPAGRQWKSAQHQCADLATVRSWFDGGHPGVGIVTGAVSGNLEMLELEGRAVTEGVHVKLKELAEASGLGQLWHRVTCGYRELTDPQWRRAPAVPRRRHGRPAEHAARPSAVDSARVPRPPNPRDGGGEAAVRRRSRQARAAAANDPRAIA
ncbi:MAG: hypothetical protein M3Q47_02755 [Actinomycetota bacterium]|nr:hypothetical protein [Actinomycetota bacterium]